MPATIIFDTATKEGQTALLAAMSRLAGPQPTREQRIRSIEFHIAKSEELLAIASPRAQHGLTTRIAQLKNDLADLRFGVGRKAVA